MGFRAEIRLRQRLRVLVYPSGLDVSSFARCFLAARLRRHRRKMGTRWRRLSVGRQALLALAHLRNGHPYAQLAAGFGIGTTTAYRYIAEAVQVLAALAPTFTEAVAPRVKESVRPARRDTAAHRPHRRRPAHLLRQAQETRHERAGHRRPERGVCCGPRRLYPVQFTTSARPVTTASSMPSPRQASPAGRTVMMGDGVTDRSVPWAD